MGFMPISGGSLVALVTPMNPGTNAIDHGALKSLLEWHLESGTAGIVALGTTGEASTMTTEERAAVLKTTTDTIGGKMPLIVGTGTIDTGVTIETTKRAKDCGADASLVVTPYYVKPPQRALLAHFTAIANAVDLPMILYNVPGRTASDLKTETVAQLSTHERIIGIKDATGELDRVPHLRELCGADFLLLSGEDALSLDFVLAGGDGVISVTANIAPAQMQELMLTAKSGNTDKAIELDSPLQGLHDKLFIEANPIPVKFALARMGRIQSGIRLPLVELAKEYHPALESAISDAGIVLR
eukprot:CAMPEP_0197290810 /NCGR_PEP_ID=MMETSP0890-20130614/10225_1 /TAXON_ID=44058 ORGANISM="Aureoumbra lagunensis, Strain CCMP1510" /NCGR_SAMPLE_ID=MMETSP0890 /ASSEMBLY_ACC=CAM_ASM_000533 /LENGTH=299 /DNA_ID=CAMNT_0042763119 /DNA_START=59 /DNA_END=958 /DNA_ORIENTATION=-